LQFAEKVLKEHISKSEKPPYTHDIERLRDKAKQHGYEPDMAIDWQVFDFNAAVRYDPTVIEMQVAVAANHESWRVGYNVLKQL
jgi:HEPN domain-containing protein